MATVGETPFAATAPQRARGSISPRAVSADVMRCLAVSTSRLRRRAWSAAAELQAWEALICRDAGEFLRAAHTNRTPLIVVDLPADETSADYRKLTDAVDQVRGMNDALIAVCGSNCSPNEEIWARCLGSWTYVNDLDGQSGMELLLGEARVALNRLKELQRPMPGAHATVVTPPP